MDIIGSVMEILKKIGFFICCLMLAACSKPDPLAEAKKNGFSSVAEMNEIKSLGHSTKKGYLVSKLPGSGCTSIEELEHTLDEIGGDCNDLKKYRYASKPMVGFSDAAKKAFELIGNNPIFLNHIVNNINHMRITACAAVGAYMSVAIIENPKIFDANQVKQHAINLAVTTLAYENLKAQGNADRQIFENYIYELKK
jgi:hypothetical protein